MQVPSPMTHTNLYGEFLIPTCNSLPPHSQVKCCYHCHFLQEALLPVPLSYCSSTSNTYPPSTHIPYNRSELVMHLTSPPDHKLLKGKDHIWLVLVCFSCLVKQQVLKYGRNEHWVILKSSGELLKIKCPGPTLRDLHSVCLTRAPVLKSSPGDFNEKLGLRTIQWAQHPHLIYEAHRTSAQSHRATEYNSQ